MESPGLYTDLRGLCMALGSSHYRELIKDLNLTPEEENQLLEEMSQLAEVIIKQYKEKKYGK